MLPLERENSLIFIALFAYHFFFFGYNKPAIFFHSEIITITITFREKKKEREIRGLDRVLYKSINRGYFWINNQKVSYFWVISD
jgi:hypothetical protein